VLADLFPTTVSEHGLLIVMAEFTGVILFVVATGAFFFALWSKREKARRERDINTAMNLRR